MILQLQNLQADRLDSGALKRREPKGSRERDMPTDLPVGHFTFKPSIYCAAFMVGHSAAWLCHSSHHCRRILALPTLGPLSLCQFAAPFLVCVHLAVLFTDSVCHLWALCGCAWLGDPVYCRKRICNLGGTVSSTVVVVSVAWILVTERAGAGLRVGECKVWVETLS